MLQRVKGYFNQFGGLPSSPGGYQSTVRFVTGGAQSHGVTRILRHRVTLYLAALKPPLKVKGVEVNSELHNDLVSITQKNQKQILEIHFIRISPVRFTRPSGSAFLHTASDQKLSREGPGNEASQVHSPRMSQNKLKSNFGLLFEKEPPLVHSNPASLLNQQSINHHRITPSGEWYKYSRNMYMYTHKNTIAAM